MFSSVESGGIVVAFFFTLIEKNIAENTENDWRLDATG